MILFEPVKLFMVNVTGGGLGAIVKLTVVEHPPAAVIVTLVVPGFNPLAEVVVGVIAPGGSGFQLTV